MKARLLAFCLVVGAVFWGVKGVAAEKEFSILEERFEEYKRDNIQSIHKRIYTKVDRHEVTANGGGVLKSDGYILGGAAYTYHLFESLGFEANFLYGGQAYDDNTILLGTLNVEFAPLYGKLSLFTIGILTFDFTFLGGAGFVHRRGLDNITSWVGDLGLGSRLFINRFMAVRIEFRDYFYRDKLNSTNELRIENNFTLTGGLSVFFPFKVAS